MWRCRPTPSRYDPAMTERTEERYDTLHDWRWQLFRACQDDRLDDVEAIARKRVPAQVALAHVAEITESDEGQSVTRTKEELELVSYASIKSLDTVEALGRFPLFRRALLREPHEHAGSCLFWAESVECMYVLLDAGADVADEGWMGLPLVVHAAQEGNLPILRHLIEERGQDPNATRKKGGYSALHWAKGREVVEYLVSQGADPKAVTDFGDSVVAQLVRQKQPEPIAFLLALGRERISTANAWHWLDECPTVDMVTTLLRGGVSPSDVAPETFGEDHPTLVLHRLLRTGIHEYADAAPEERESAGQRLTAFVELVLEHGFDPTVRDGYNQLAWHVVEDHRDVLDAALFDRLTALLGPYDGERVDPPEGPQCTCGLNL